MFLVGQEIQEIPEDLVDLAVLVARVDLEDL